MKSVLFCFAVLMATIAVYGDDRPILPIPTRCPEEDSMDYTVLLAHEWDCTKYYACQQGKRIPRGGLSCPEMNAEGDRLYFNPRLQVCDWPFNVNCDLSGKPPSDETEESDQLDEDIEDPVLNRMLMN